MKALPANATTEERIQYLRSLPTETITPTQTSVILGGKPYWYNLAAREGMLTLPHLWRGRNLRIFRQPIINLLTEGATTTWQTAQTTEKNK